MTLTIDFKTIMTFMNEVYFRLFLSYCIAWSKPCSAVYTIEEIDPFLLSFMRKTLCKTWGIFGQSGQCCIATNI